MKGNIEHCTDVLAQLYLSFSLKLPSPKLCEGKGTWDSSSKGTCISQPYVNICLLEIMWGILHSLSFWRRVSSGLLGEQWECFTYFDALWICSLFKNPFRTIVFPFAHPYSDAIALTNLVTTCFQAALAETQHQHLPLLVVHLVGKIQMQSHQNCVSFLAVYLLFKHQLFSLLQSGMVVSLDLLSCHLSHHGWLF